MCQDSSTVVYEHVTWFLDVECYTFAPSPLVKSLPELAAYEQSSLKKCNDQFCLHTVAVKCGKASMEVHVKADLFGTGVHVHASELAVFSAGSDEHSCRAREAGEAEYVIEVPFDKCGTGFQMNGDGMIYSNLLLYSPTPPPRGIMRLGPVTIPIQCWFSRKYRVSSAAVVPTWSPLISTVSQQSELDLGIKLMTRDWSSELLHGVYQLGEVINVEASVGMGARMPLRVYVDTCVATQLPDVTTSPRYAFIENNGCMIDGLVTSSTASYFLPRLQNDRLQFQLEAFRFQNSPSNDSVILITCILKAVLIGQGYPAARACSYMDGRWRSADDSDQVCLSCSHGHLDQSVLYSQSGGYRKLSKRQSNGQRESIIQNARLQPEALGGPLLTGLAVRERVCACGSVRESVWERACVTSCRPRTRALDHSGFSTELCQSVCHPLCHPLCHSLY
ncbi:zona pellucida sperm-binding protein 3-like [Salminus brasiliensis]|uniref:zona pellucida sperm-binding protein 3-like n=1 Tax=Salminus brasiliensis TaxID=930266 RepID=UPI003B838DC7